MILAKNDTYGYMGKGNYASNIRKIGKSCKSSLTKPNMEGINIIAIRKRLQLSQAVFARLLNVDRANLCKWEHDKVVPSPMTVAKIAAYRNLGKKALRKKLQELEVKMWDN